MGGDEAPPASATQDALRVLLAEVHTAAATGAKVEALTAHLQALTTRLDRHLSESERDRADFEAMQNELKASTARLESEIKRLSDAASAVAALEKEKATQAVATAQVQEARWKERGAAWAAMVGMLGLVLKEVIGWVTSRR